MQFFSAEKNKDFTDNIKSDFSLEDLNFDPAAIIGEGTGDWGVSILLTKLRHKGWTPIKNKVIREMSERNFFL